MKKYLLVFGITIFCMICSDMASAGWLAQIKAQGQELEGVNESSVFIGVSSLANTSPAPPEPPDYSVKIELSAPDQMTRLSKDIQKQGESAYKWLIAVNPHGDIMPPSPRSSTILWDPSQFGLGSVKLIQGTDETGTVLADMKAASQHEIEGEDKDYFFLIVYDPSDLYSLSDAIRILQLLAGMDVPSFSFADLNNDDKTGMAEVIYILQRIAEIGG